MPIKLPLIILSIVILIGANLGFQVWGRAAKAPMGEVWTVTRVLNGQTVVAKSNSVTQRIRLLGISAPWKEQEPWGNLARLRLEQLVKDRSVTLEFDLEPDRSQNIQQTEKDNRLQAYIWQGDTLVNAQLVKEGYVLADANSSNSNQYKTKLELWQSEARLLELGIWEPLNPMRIHPKDFRRQLLR